ncbi:hypothetical protein [Geobacillus thermoleovorans]|uniref:hypothetical protein n=1 Tax=Geobacillus thermoleovorans TaxID=33941 RepID=UPI003D1ECA31
MIVIATFESHLFVELAISALQEKGLLNIRFLQSRSTALPNRRACLIRSITPTGSASLTWRRF